MSSSIRLPVASEPAFRQNNSNDRSSVSRRSIARDLAPALFRLTSSVIRTMSGHFSKTVTSWPNSQRILAAAMPLKPEPMTATFMLRSQDCRAEDRRLGVLLRGSDGHIGTICRSAIIIIDLPQRSGNHLRIESKSEIDPALECVCAPGSPSSWFPPSARPASELTQFAFGSECHPRSVNGPAGARAYYIVGRDVSPSCTNMNTTNTNARGDLRSAMRAVSGHKVALRSPDICSPGVGLGFSFCQGASFVCFCFFFFFGA